jgi:Putative exonuclease SbcCD, C subunit
VRDARTAIKSMSKLMSSHPTGSGIQVRLNWAPDEKNAPGMQEIVALMAKDAPLESERARLQDFFRSHVAAIRATADADYKSQMGRLLDYRQWWRFTVSFRRAPDQPYEPLTSKAHGSLSGGEKAVCLHLPLFAAAASYCNSAGVLAIEPDGSESPGSPRLILLDEVFAGVDEDNRGDLFELVRALDLDLVATSESEQGFYSQLDGIAVYHLVGAADALLGSRTLWDGNTIHRLLDLDAAMNADKGPTSGNAA